MGYLTYCVECRFKQLDIIVMLKLDYAKITKILLFQSTVELCDPFRPCLNVGISFPVISYLVQGFSIIIGSYEYGEMSKME